MNKMNAYDCRSTAKPSSGMEVDCCRKPQPSQSTVSAQLSALSSVIHLLTLLTTSISELAEGGSCCPDIHWRLR